MTKTPHTQCIQCTQGRGPRFDPFQGSRFNTPQLRVYMPQLKILLAATKIKDSVCLYQDPAQLNKKINIKKKKKRCWKDSISGGCAGGRSSPWLRPLSHTRDRSDLNSWFPPSPVRTGASSPISLPVQPGPCSSHHWAPVFGSK